LNKR